MKKKSTNLIIIAGPFQLLNAIESIHQFKLNKVFLLVFKNKNEKTNQQIELYIQKHNNLFQTIKWIEFKKKGIKKYFEYYHFLSFFKNYNFTYICLATINKVTKLILTKVNHRHLIVFDDGLETLHTIKYLSKSEKLISLKYFIFGWKRSIANDFICFSIFEHNIPKIKYIKNNMNFIKNKQNQVINQKKIAFIGQDFVNTYLQKKAYFKILNYLTTFYPQKAIEYFPHRGESKEILLEIQSKFPTISIIPLDITFEMYLSEEKILPYKLYSCWSTVIIVIKSIFPNIQVEAIAVERRDLLKNQNKILDTYKYFEQENIKILEIP